jgi:hypothetical protein
MPANIGPHEQPTSNPFWEPVVNGARQPGQPHWRTLCRRTQTIFNERIRELFLDLKRGERLARRQGRSYPAREQSDGDLRHREQRG